MKNEIILYRPNELAEHIEVRIIDDTVWLNRQQISSLFARDVKTIGKHINNVFSEGELHKEVVVANFATTTQHGAIKGKTQTIQAEHYNLDVIISVGYRVKSKQGTQFRIWANRVLKDYLLRGYAVNNRMTRLEDNMEALKSKVNEIDLQINTHLIPTQGVFFDGQVFDAHYLISKIIGSAKKNIVLIDNYIDESV
ncbi:MAG: RhuM family protein, partial [Lutibacter sp.]|nr:RhuM family protein [Lutibacter sp.]